MDPAHLIHISIGAIFINNFVLARFLGLCPFFGVSKKLSGAVGMGMAVIFVMSVTSVFTWTINRYVLVRHNLDYLQTIVFILVIASLVQLVEMTIRKFLPVLHEVMGIYLPLITTNCAILGVAKLNMVEEYSFVESLVNGIASGAGFTLALVLMAGIRERLDLADIPQPLRGLPIAFVTAALMSIAFLGFRGMVFLRASGG